MNVSGDGPDPYSSIPGASSGSAITDSFSDDSAEIPSEEADMGSSVSPQGGVMAAGMFSSMFATIGGAISNSIALESQAAYKQQQSNFNAKMAELESQNALQQGDFQSQEIQRNANNAIGQSRVSAAAGGIEVNSGSAMDVQNSISKVSSIDILTAKNNAVRKAYGYNVEANNDTTEGQIAKNTGNAAAASTAITGGLNAAGEGLKGYYYGSGGTINSTNKV